MQDSGRRIQSFEETGSGAMIHRNHLGRSGDHIGPH